MKSSIILSAAMLTAASASPVSKRIVAQEFDISEFSAGCVPHGTGCSFSFKVATNQMPFPTTCTANFPTTAFNLPDVPFTACADPSIVWSFQAVKAPGSQPSNYSLTLADAEQSLAASKIFPASDFPVVNAGSTIYQQYQGSPYIVVK